MLFNLIIFVAFAAVAYFHYAEGLFSSTISAILCIIAAVVAMGYYQWLVPYLFKIPDQADAVAIVVLFAGTYVITRLIFDRAVPGNVRFPLLMDKIGAGVMGVFAGLFSSGVMAIAAQTLPFGPGFGGYNRQDLQDRPNVTLSPDALASNRTSSIDSFVTDELVGSNLGDANHINHLWLHQDELVLALTRQFGATGSALSNGQSIDQAYPDLLTELFGQRLGSPVSAKRELISTDKLPAFRVSAAYSLSKLPPSSLIMDGEIAGIRGDQPLPDVPSPASDTHLVVLRVDFNQTPDAADSDGILRISPASVRLKAGKSDYYPVGTLVGGTLIMKNRPDDPLLVDISKSGRTVDFLFVINTEGDGGDLKIGDSKDKTVAFRDASFLEIKRFATADLSNMAISSEVPSAQLENDFDKAGTLGGVMRPTSVGTNALDKLSAAQQAEQTAARKPRGKSAGTQPADTSKAPPPGQSHNKSDEFLPQTPGNLMGL